jgi:hypothetical protein
MTQVHEGEGALSQLAHAVVARPPVAEHRGVEGRLGHGASASLPPHRVRGAGYRPERRGSSRSPRRSSVRVPASEKAAASTSSSRRAAAASQRPELRRRRPAGCGPRPARRPESGWRSLQLLPARRSTALPVIHAAHCNASRAAFRLPFVSRFWASARSAMAVACRENAIPSRASSEGRTRTGRSRIGGSGSRTSETKEASWLFVSRCPFTSPFSRWSLPIEDSIVETGRGTDVAGEWPHRSGPA